MKKFLVLIAFIVWVLATLILVLSVIGLFFLITNEDEWMGIGKNLILTFKSE